VPVGNLLNRVIGVLLVAPFLAPLADIFQNWEQSGAVGFIWAEFFAYARQAVETLKFLRSLNAGVLEHSEKYGFTLGEGVTAIIPGDRGPLT